MRPAGKAQVLLGFAFYCAGSGDNQCLAFHNAIWRRQVVALHDCLRRDVILRRNSVQYFPLPHEMTLFSFLKRGIAAFSFF
jgi:hypothetical protein